MPRQAPEQETSLITNVGGFIACGVVLEGEYKQLAQSLSPRKENSLLFAYEPTVSPQQFCQTLMHYVYSAYLIIDWMLNQNQVSPQISKQFVDTFYQTKDLILQFNDKYGKKTSVAACKAELFADLDKLGTDFLMNKIDFEQQLQSAQPNVNLSLRKGNK